MAKFKVGDRVRIIKRERDGWDCINSGKVGDEFTIEKIVDSCLSKIEKWVKGEGKSVGIHCLELVEETIEQKELIIHCPTKEDWIKVCKKLEKDYPDLRWKGGEGKPTEFEYWDKYNSESVIYPLLDDNYNLSFGDVDCAKENYPHIPITPANEFLGEEDKPMRCYCAYYKEDKPIRVMLENGMTFCPGENSPWGTLTLDPEYNNKINKEETMSNKVIKAIKDLNVSSDDKLLRKFGMLDEELNRTRDYRDAVYELEAKERGYKSFEEMICKLGTCDIECEPSAFELDDLIKKHLPALIEQCKKLEAEEKKKK